MDRTDALVGAVAHGLLGAVAALLAGAAGANALAAGGGAAALDAARPFDAAADGWRAASGEVAAPAPLLSYNKDACALLEEVTTTSTLRLGGGGAGDRLLDRRSVVRSRSVRDTAWALVPPGAADASAGAGGVLVERDAARLAYERDGRAVQGLTHGGAVVVPTQRPWYVVVWKLLLGVLDEETVSVHNVLPVGVPATVVAQLTRRASDGRWVASLHPSLGLYVLRGVTVDAASAAFRSSARWWGAGAAVAGTIAAWQLWKAALYAVPGLLPLRRLAAEAALRALGWRIPSWLALENPGGSSAPAPSAGEEAAHPPYADIPLAPDEVAAAAAGGAGGGSGEVACCVCMERRRIAVLVPCGHMVTCLACAHALAGAPEVARRRCPVCRTPFGPRDIVRVFGAPPAPATTSA